MSNKENNEPIITKLIVHDEELNFLFSIYYDKVTGKLVFSSKDNEIETKHILQMKSVITSEKGVEAIGTFLSGADNEIPLYRHTLTVYLPKELDKFDKFHITFESILEQLNMEKSLLLTSECYAVIFDILQDFVGEKEININDYPLLEYFLYRNYSSKSINYLLNDKNVEGETLDDSNITNLKKSLIKDIDRHNEILKSVNLYITTITGAIVGQASFHNIGDVRKVIKQISNNKVTTPGAIIQNGISTTWFPFTKNKIGRIDRTMFNTINSMAYASANRKNRDQIQSNLAHKLHDLIEIITEDVGESNQTYGLTTNVGYLICSIEFNEKYENDLDTILDVSLLLSPQAKLLGQAILGHMSKVKAFKPIIN